MKTFCVFLSLVVATFAEPPVPFVVYGPPSAQPGPGGIVAVPAPEDDTLTGSKPTVTKLTTLVQLPAASGEKYFPAGTKGFNSPNANAPDLLPPSKRVEIIVKPGTKGFARPAGSHLIGVVAEHIPGKNLGGGNGGSPLHPAGGVSYPYPSPVVPAVVYGPPSTPAPTPTVKISYPYPSVVTKAPVIPKITYVSPKYVPPTTTPTPVSPVVVYGPPTTAAPVPTIKVKYPYPPAVPTVKFVPTTTPKPVKPAVVYGPPSTAAPVVPKITYITPKYVPEPTTAKPVSPAIVYGPPSTAAPVPTIKVKYPYPPAVPTVKFVPTTTPKPVKPAVVYGPPSTAAPVVPKITYITTKYVPEPTTAKPVSPALVYGPPSTAAPVPTIKIQYPYPPPTKVVPSTTARPVAPVVVYGPPTAAPVIPKISYVTPKPVAPTTPAPSPVVPAVVYGPPSVPATKDLPTPAPQPAGPESVLPSSHGPAGTGLLKPEINLSELLPMVPQPEVPPKVFPYPEALPKSTPAPKIITPYPSAAPYPPTAPYPPARYPYPSAS